MQTEADEGDETREVFNDGSDSDTAVENWSSSSCSSVLTESAAVVSRFISFWKNSPCCFEQSLIWTFYQYVVFCNDLFLCLYDHSNDNKNMLSVLYLETFSVLRSENILCGGKFNEEMKRLRKNEYANYVIH
jgi:hypothetical protein